MYVIFYRNNNDANGGDDQIQLEKPEMERVEWRLLQAARGGRRRMEDSFSSRGRHASDAEADVVRFGLTGGARSPRATCSAVVYTWPDAARRPGG